MFFEGLQFKMSHSWCIMGDLYEKNQKSCITWSLLNESGRRPVNMYFYGNHSAYFLQVVQYISCQKEA